MFTKFQRLIWFGLVFLTVMTPRIDQADSVNMANRSQVDSFASDSLMAADFNIFEFAMNPILMSENTFIGYKSPIPPETQEIVLPSLASLASGRNPSENPSENAKTIATHFVEITAYSSSRWQTDSTPFITAQGTSVRDGVVAANFLPFGTKVKIPELFGDKEFIVEDRMNRRYDYRLDIWMSSYGEAREFGVRKAQIVVEM